MVTDRSRFQKKAPDGSSPAREREGGWVGGRKREGGGEGGRGEGRERRRGA